MMTTLIASLIFAMTLVLILTDRVHRLIASASGAAAMLTAGLLLGFYSEEQAIASIDFETLGCSWA